MQRLVPNLWFPGNAEEAAAYWVAIFPDSRIVSTTPYGPDTPGVEGTTMVVEWEMLGQRYVGINGGDQFPFSEAVSLEVPCDTQEEIDRTWAALADGGRPGPCGWVTDRFGFRWQVTPVVLPSMLADPDRDRVARVTQYFLSLDGVPFSIDDLQAAFDASGGD
ncbi:hypothetical protein GCM10011519_04860 [Marmoricola endophyticus]|uniref:PhnB-like domain-containing protein n=1 Tax=Marmoricola endophyticus TaxID=2040280 RepID=A0A917EZ86_9ACTN|nr:VOC family protein [Marmoricola endophyticus]GGF34421.1 hypothetical protein GCM10011519_04860 [Marmoricola endophyticus]